MIISEILKKKRMGYNLNKSEIEFIINGLFNGNVADYQAAAFLTSSCIHGLNNEEILALTFAMRDSGFKFNFSNMNKKIVDKHSTGGVGDKISLLLVPILMCFDVAIPMISGRGLGHTGGTVDKLESIVGFNIRPDKETFYNLIEKQNGFMACQTDDIAPADKILYHLRDVTGNVESVGLITASILSKKLVEDLDVLVIDLKVGNGAFMKNMDEARDLANSIGNVCSLAGVKCSVIFTNMSQPLGMKIGNWLEIEETIEALSGDFTDDIRELTVELATSILLNADIFNKKETAKSEIEKCWDSGDALNNFYKMIASQNGDLEKSKLQYTNVHKIEVKSENTGYIVEIDTLNLGIASLVAGAGRRTVDDKIDYSAGFILNKKLGDYVDKGELLLTIKGEDFDKLNEAAKIIANCFKISEQKPFESYLIIDEWKF